MGPLEIIHQRPMQISPHVRALFDCPVCIEKMVVDEPFPFYIACVSQSILSNIERLMVFPQIQKNTLEAVGMDRPIKIGEHVMGLVTDFSTPYPHVAVAIIIHPDVVTAPYCSAQHIPVGNIVHHVPSESAVDARRHEID